MINNSTYLKILFFAVMLSFFTKNGTAQQIVINEFMSSNYASWYDENQNTPDWIELYNSSNSSVNLSNYALSDKRDNLRKWVFLNDTIGAKSILIIAASGENKKQPNSALHTNFKISAEGERLFLTNNAGIIIDSTPKVPLPANYSYGRIKDGNDTMGVFFQSTPNASNNSSFFIEEISFSRKFGFHSAPFNLQLTCSDSIYYSIDGSEPTTQSKLYANTIRIDAKPKSVISLIPTTHIRNDSESQLENQFGFKVPDKETRRGVAFRAQSFKNGQPTSKIYSGTFFTNADKYSFPVISLILDSNHLFNYVRGIYVPGINWAESNVGWTGNYYQRGRDWERIASMEFFNEHRFKQFSETIGLRISGKKSRDYPQKSLRVYFRKNYGKSEIPNYFFQQRAYDELQRISLRSSFTYWNDQNLLFQDDIIHELAWRSGLNIDVQHSQPSIVFINGEYWGIHNIRERQDNDHISDLYDIPKNGVNIISGNLNLEEGDPKSFKDLLEFTIINELSNLTNYAHVESIIDIDSYVDYFIIETFLGNSDWPDNNMKMWRKNEEGSKWRWLLYDVDATGVYPNNNPFIFLKDTANDQVQLFRSLMESGIFVERFTNRYFELLSTSFLPFRIQEMVKIKMELYGPEISAHIDRWGNPVSYENWIEGCKQFLDFLDKRPCVVQQALIDLFELPKKDILNCIEEPEAITQLSIYPNPSSAFIEVKTNATIEEPLIFEIFYSNGLLIQSYRLTENKHTINLDNYSDGLYIGKTTINGRSNVLKFVIAD